jgi:hypothetical protein
MKIEEIIAPGKRKPLPAADVDDIWLRILSKRCTEAIDAYRSARKLLYRGMKTEIPWFRAASHQTRRPKDSSRRISEVFDELLYANGMKALRSNSIFATSSFEDAAEFGLVYAILPVDGFKFTYTKEKDIVLETWSQVIDQETMRKLDYAYEEAMTAKEDEPYKLPYGQDWITADHRNYDVATALDRLKQISTNPWVQSLEEDDLFNIDEFRKRYAPSNHLLEHAIDHGREVMISGQYYAFRTGQYNQKLQELVFGS